MMGFCVSNAEMFLTNAHSFLGDIAEKGEAATAGFNCYFIIRPSHTTKP
jgi:hypothetical protein